MIRINLIGGGEADQAGKRVSRSRGVRDVAATLGAVVALAAATAYVAFDAWALRRTSVAVKRALAAADGDRQKRVAPVETLETEERRRAALERQVEQLSRWRATRGAPVGTFDAVSRSLPDGLWLTELRQDVDALVVAGRAARPAALFEFASNLEASGQVASPLEVVGTNAAGTGRFEIRAAPGAAMEN